MLLSNKNLFIMSLSHAFLIFSRFNSTYFTLFGLEFGQTKSFLSIKRKAPCLVTLTSLYVKKKSIEKCCGLIKDGKTQKQNGELFQTETSNSSKELFNVTTFINGTGH